MGRKIEASFVALVVAGTSLAGTAASLAQDASSVAFAPSTEVITVRGEFFPNEKQATSEISSLVDSEDFQIAGDSDAAGALVRVTGVTLQAGKFVYVRGLNERYTSATLNGSPLPSPEPLRRIAPLDLFPTSVLSSILVQKTFSPEKSGEFAGGSVDMRTTAVPSQRFFDVSASIGYNDVTTQQPGLMYDGSDSDWTGLDDGLRNYPSELTGVLGQTRLDALTVAEREAVGEGLIANDTRLLVQSRGDVAPDAGGSVSLGDRFDVSPSLSFGVVGALRYDSSWDTREGVRRTTNPGGVVEDYRRRSTQNDVETSALLGLGVDIADNHSIQLTGLGTRVTAKEARSLDGFDPFSVGGIRRIDNNEWLERQVWLGQLHGDHTIDPLGGLSVGWRASYSEALRDAPFQTEIAYDCFDPVTGAFAAGTAGELCDDLGGVFLFSQVGGTRSNRFQFSKIEDESSDLGVDFSQPFKIFGLDGDINFGAAHTEHSRDSELHIYTFTGANVLDPSPATPLNEFYQQRVDALFSKAFVDPSFYMPVEVGGQSFPEAHTGTLEVDALYLGVDVQITPFIRAALGARYEDALETLDTFNRTLPDNGLLETRIANDSILPAATITWNFTDDMQLRVGASQSLTRPELRELAFQEFIDTESDVSFQGNPFLRDARINNYDARWEYYFGRDQLVTAGIFYKEIKNPIEEIVIPSGSSLTTTFLNAPSATLQGFELEFEKVIGADEIGLGNAGWLASKDFLIRTNYTLTDASVDASGFVTTCISSCSGAGVAPDTQPADLFIRDGRQLQGQSEHVFNLALGYEDPTAGERATLLYNYASERIRAAERLGASSAIIEQPPASLDFTYSRAFEVLSGEVQIGFRATNLLGEDYEATQEAGGQDVIVDSYDIGRSYSVTLTARY